MHQHLTVKTLVESGHPLDVIKFICLNMAAKYFLDGVCIKIISKLGHDNGKVKTNYLDFLLINEEVYVSDCVWPVECKGEGCNVRFCDCLSKFSSIFSKF